MKKHVILLSAGRRAGVMAIAVCGLISTLPAYAAMGDTVNRLKESASVFSEIMATPDKGIPDDLLQQSHCVVIVPGVKKGAFIVSGEYGRGFVTCRNKAGWSAPAALRLEGGGVGFQIGGSETDLVMLVMNEKGADRLMSSQFTLGAEGDVAAGPVGRQATAQTDAKMTAEILSWSRARGVFAGVALKGATLRADENSNAELYGRKMSTKEVVASSVPVPDSARSLMTMLARYSPKSK